METGVGVGGPRDGVRLTASTDWDGRVQKPGTFADGSVKRYYPGRYVWLSITSKWLWVPALDSKGTRSPRAQ